MKIAHIAPNELIEDAVRFSGIDMVLAHKVLEDSNYTEKYRHSRNYRLVDNSFYELGYSLSSEDIRKAAKLVNADCVILQDGTLNELNEFKEFHYDVMAIPTDYNQLKEFYNSKVDKIGISGIHFSKYMNCDILTPGYRREILLKLKSELGSNYNPNRFHILGAVNFVLKEIEQIRDLVGSMDTSAACWNAVNNIELFDDTLKLSEKVDFNIHVDVKMRALALKNMSKMNLLAVRH